MSGTYEGRWKSAARKLGMDYTDYVAHVDAGEQRCWACKTWKPNSQFRRRRGYEEVLSAHCIDCHRVYMREYMRRRTSQRGQQSEG